MFDFIHKVNVNNIALLKYTKLRIDIENFCLRKFNLFYL